jgi:hypothetical protein
MSRFRIAGFLAAGAIGAVALGLFTAPHRPEAVRGDNAAGDTVCLSCHGQMATYEQTAHRLTSRLPAGTDIQGSFSRGENILRTANPNLYYRMDSAADGFYETGVMGRGPDTSVNTQRIAFVTGLRKGQSFLYWRGDQLFQLPVSYWKGMGWVNSPGYPDGRPNFDRPIPPRCLECHASWFPWVADPSVVNRYRPTGAILGITCETCHGAGRDHAAHERSPFHALLPTAIVNPARLPRARQLDGCALCHSGTAPLQTAAFTHVPGGPLEKRFDLSTPPDTGEIDVHGNQLALLERSRCFRSSHMTCATCHDVHQEQRDVAALSGRCLTCHTEQSCGLSQRHGQQLIGHCADCHMPLLPSTTVIFNHLGDRLRQQVRTHWIKVYPQTEPPPAGGAG